MSKIGATIVAECPTCALSASVSAELEGREATCRRCKTKFVIRTLMPRPEAGASAPPACPFCQESWLEEAEEGSGALECASCTGSFLPATASRALVQDLLRIDPELLPELEAFTKTEPVDCAGCGEPMRLLEVKGVAIDWCPSCCGIWLDEGELHRLSGGRWGKPARERGLLERIGEPKAMGLRRLMETNELVVRQDPEWGVGTVLFGWDKANWYDIRGYGGTVLQVAEERRSVWDDLIRNFFQNHGRKLFVLDKYGQQILLELYRRWFVLVASMEVRIAEGGPRLGKVRRTLNPIFKIYQLFDARGEQFATISGGLFRFWNYEIREHPGNAVVGRIRKRWSGLRQEMYTRGDKLTIEFGERDWTIEERSILLAAVIAIDLDAFEGAGGFED